MRNSEQVKTALIRRSKSFRPEFVVAGSGRQAQTPGDLHERKTARINRLGDDPETTVLGQRTGGPAQPSVLDQPIVGDRMMDVTAIEKGDQETDVEQSLHRSSDSSRSRRTSSVVTTRPLAGITSNPAASLRPGTGRVTLSPAEGCCSPRRKTSEMTCPAVRRDRAASSFAAIRTSGSKSRVVLMHLMLLHQMYNSSSTQ